MVGKLELGRSIALPLLAITMLQLRAVQVTDAKGEYSFADYFGARLLMTAFGILALWGIAWGWYAGETAWVILLWGLAKSIDSISDIIRGLFQRHERMNLSGMSFMIKAPAALLAMGTLLWLTAELTIAITGVILTSIIVLFLYDLRQAHRLLYYKATADKQPARFLPNFNLKVIRELLWLALPLGLVLFLTSLQVSIPKLVLNSYHGEEALGYFGPLIYPIVMGTVVVSAMGQSASPRLAKYYVNNLRAYCKLVKKLLLLAFGMGLLFIAAVTIFGKFALRVLYTAEYAEYHTDFIILSVGAAATFMLFFCGHGLTAARALKVQLVLAMASCSVAVVFTFLLIPTYGLRGAVITSVATVFTMCACYFGTLLYVIHKRQRELEADNTKSG